MGESWRSTALGELQRGCILCPLIITKFKCESKGGLCSDKFRRSSKGFRYRVKFGLKSEKEHYQTKPQIPAVAAIKKHNF